MTWYARQVVGVGKSGTASARRALILIFGAHACVIGTWTVRIPAIKDSIGLSATELAIAFTCGGVGALAAARASGFVVDRLGSGRSTRLTASAFVASLLGLALATNLPSLCAALFVTSGLAATTDVAMNAQGVAFERLLERPTMSRLHGAWSGSALLASGVSAAIAAFDAPYRIQLVITAIVLFPVTLLAGHRLVTTTPRGWSPNERRSTSRLAFAHGAPRVVMFAALGFAIFFVEGTASNWGAVYFHSVLHASQGVAGAGVVAFAIGMTISRLAADAFAHKLGARPVIRLAIVMSVVGLCVVVGVSSIGLAVAGIAIFGLGVGPIAPLVFSAVGRVSSTHGLSWVVTVSYGGSIIAPVVIGLTSFLAGLRVGFALPLVLLLGIGAAARSLDGAARPRVTVGQAVGN